MTAGLTGSDVQYQPVAQSDDDTGTTGGEGTAKLVPQPTFLNTKADEESFGSVLLRRNNWVSGLFDTLATVISTLMGMSTKTFSASAPNSDLTNGANTAAANLGLVGSWGFFFSNFFYGLRILFTGIGKQNRLGKIAFGLLNICGLLIAGNSLFVLGMMGFTMAAGLSIAFLALPWVYVLMNMGIILRNSIRFWRTSKGLDPEGLLEQKEEKLRLARESDPFMRLDYIKEIRAARIARFTLEVALLKYFLMQAFGKTSVKKEELEQNRHFQKYKNNTLSEKELYKIINKDFGGNYNTFIAEVDKGNEKYTEIANRYGAGLIVAQQQKYDTRKIFFVLGLILSITFIAISVLGFIVTGGTAAAPLFAVSAAAIAGLKIAGAGLGLSVLACLGGFSFFSIKFAYGEYTKYRDEAAKHPKGDPHHDEWQQLLKDQKTSMGLRIGGMAIFLVSSLLVASSFLPFVNVAILGIVGMSLVVAGMAMFIAGAVKLYHARQAEKRLNALDDASEDQGPGNTPSAHLDGPDNNPSPFTVLHTKAASGDKKADSDNKPSTDDKLSTVTPYTNFGVTEGLRQRRHSVHVMQSTSVADDSLTSERTITVR